MSTFYKYNVVAKIGDRGIQDLGEITSINDAGKVAFIGDLDSSSSGSEGIFVWDGSLKNILSTTSDSPLNFGTIVQINNQDKVIANLRFNSGTGGTYLYDINNIDNTKTLATAGGSIDFFPPYNFDYYILFPVVAVNNNNQSVFTGFEENLDISFNPFNFFNPITYSYSPGDPQIISSAIPGSRQFKEKEWPSFQLSRANPVIADNGNILMKFGIEPSSPLILYDNAFNPITTIASSSNFTNIGRKANISDDGRAVAFYADFLSNSKLGEGSGVFVSLNNNGAWQTIPIAADSILGDDVLDPWEDFIDLDDNGIFNPDQDSILDLFGSIDVESPISIASNGSTITVSYLATDISDNETLFISTIDLLSTAPVISAPQKVASVGEFLNNSSDRITDLYIHDSVNKDGQVAFWADSTGGEKILVANPSGFLIENEWSTVQDGTLIFKVRLSESLPDDVVLNYRTLDGTANSDGSSDKKDFDAINNGTLTFKAGSLQPEEGDIEISLLDNEGLVTDEQFEFLARNTAYKDWNNEREDIDGVDDKASEIDDLGYRVDKYFDDSTTDFQAVGLTSTENFYLLLSDPTNSVINSPPTTSAFLNQVSDDLGGDTTSQIYQDANNVINQLNDSGQSWTVATGTIYDEERSPILSVRGTTNALDWFGNSNPNTIGFEQFTANIGDVSNWLENVSQPEKDENNNPLIDLKPHITGHSLGGALTQLIASDYLTNADSSFSLGNIVTFNSPGIDETIANNIDVNRVEKIEHNIMSADIVSMAGEEFLLDSTVNLYDYSLGIIGEGHIFDFRTPHKGIFDTHLVPMYLSDRGQGKLKKPNFFNPPKPLTSTTISSNEASSFFFTYLPDPDYFTFIAAVTVAADIINPFRGIEESRLPIPLIASSLLFRGTTEIARQLAGSAIRTVIDAIESNSSAIQTGTNAYNSSINWPTTAWNTIIDEAKSVLNIFQPSIDTFLFSDSDANGISDLDTALLQAKNELTEFAGSGTFDDDMVAAFSDGLSTQATKTLQQKWLTNDFSDLPSIEIVPASEIGGYNGVFTSLGDIYLSEDFLNTNNIDAVVDVLLEEIGHWVDTQVNEFNAPGDRGRIFASVVQEISLSSEELETLQNEDDFVALALEDPSTYDENVIDNFWKAINFFTEASWEALGVYPDEAWMAMSSWGETGWTTVSQWTDENWDDSQELTPEQWEATEEFDESDWNNVFSSSTNAPPVANDDTATTNKDIPVTINVLTNDTDADLDSLSINSFDLNSIEGGMITLDDNNTPVDESDDRLIYTPATGFTGTDTFEYIVSDGQDSDTATVEVTVNSVVITNNPPVANDDTVTTNEDTVVTINVLANDTDTDNDSLSIDSFEPTSTEGGIITLDDNNTPVDESDDRLIYTPATGFTGTDTFEYIVSDGQDSDTATVEVTVNPDDGEPNIINGTTGRDILTGTDGDDIITGDFASDRLTGGLSNDTFVYNELRDVGDTITDFTLGEDTIDFSDLLSNLGISSAQVGFADTPSGTAITLDSNNSGIFRNFLLVKGDGVNAATLNDAENLVF